MNGSRKMNNKKCCICGKDYGTFGNNAEPIAKGYCCDKCNGEVISARLRVSAWKEVVLGKLYQTRGINNAITKDLKFAKEIMIALGKYTNMNWGDTCASDKKLNDNAVFYSSDRIVAKYITSKGNIFIITEWDRNATTVLFAEEY
jgi:hypothetical protein